MIETAAAGEADMPDVARIYAHEVLHGVATFEEVPPGAAEMAGRWRGITARGLPYVVAREAGRVVAFAYASPYRPRPAYRFCVETTVYVDPSSRGRGAGRAALAAVIAGCEAGPWRQMIAVIGDSGNAASIGLHRAMGFEHRAVLAAVGFKQGRWVDTVIMQRALGPGGGRLPQ